MSVPLNNWTRNIEADPARFGAVHHLRVHEDALGLEEALVLELEPGHGHPDLASDGGAARPRLGTHHVQPELGSHMNRDGHSGNDEELPHQSSC